MGMHQANSCWGRHDFPSKLSAANHYCNRLQTHLTAHLAPRKSSRKGKQRSRTVTAVSKYDDDFKNRQQDFRGRAPDRGLDAKEKVLKPTTILPIVIGLAAASTLGPLVLSLAAGVAGLAIATVAGVTAMTVFLPVVLFVGGTVAAFSIMGS